MLASALTLSSSPQILATGDHKSEVLYLPPPPDPVPRWLQVILQPWKWNQACWDDSDDFSDGVNERDSDDGVILVSSPVSSSVNHEAQNVMMKMEDMNKTTERPKSPDSIAPSRPHLETIDSAFYEMPPLLPHGCPREIYIQPRVSHATTNASRPPALHHSDRLSSFETALTESEDDEIAYQHGDEDDDDESASAGTASHNESGLPRPVGASRCSSLPFRPPRPEQARERSLSTSVPPRPPIYGRDRASTYSSVASTSSRHRRWKISVSPQSVQQIYNNTKSETADNKESRDDVTTAPAPVANSPTGIHSFEDEKKEDEDSFYHQECVPEPPKQKLDDQQWMHQWVDMKPEENPVSTSPTSSTLTSRSKTTILCSPELPAKGDPFLYYWCKNESLRACIPRIDEENILLEGLALFESSDRSSSGSPCIRRVYLAVVKLSPGLYMVDSSDKTCTTWALPSSHLDLSVHMQYRSKSEGYSVELKSSAATLVTLVPLSSKKRRRLDEAAQHNAALHLWFVLDTWRQQQQEQRPVQMSSQATTKYASWDEAQVRAVEQRLLLRSNT